MDEKDERPWDCPGAVRRDWELDRGEMLRPLGAITLGCGMWVLFSSIMLPIDPDDAFVWLCQVPALVGLSLGPFVWVMSTRDLAKMQANLMDPDGISHSRDARTCAVVGTLLCAPSCICAGIFFVSRLWHS
jgi:hypothetical protein